MTPEKHVRNTAHNPPSREAPGFLRRRDSRGLFPEVTPDPAVVAKIKRIDPRWRVEFHRGMGRFCLWHDHEQFGRATTPTIVVQTKDRQFLPLDHRVVRQVEIGAWVERHAHSPEEYDEVIDRVLRDLHEEEVERQKAERRYWLKQHVRGIKRAFEDDVFFKPRPEPPAPIYFT